MELVGSYRKYSWSHWRMESTNFGTTKFREDDFFFPLEFSHFFQVFIFDKSLTHSNKHTGGWRLLILEQPNLE